MVLGSDLLVETLTVTRVEVLQGVRNMESPPPSERVAPTGSGNVGDSVRNGV